MISGDLFDEYNKQRFTKERGLICHAPFINMYVNVHGQVGACWLTFYQSPKWPEKSLEEIWFGDFFNGLRKRIKERNLVSQCSPCKENILSRNFMGTLANAYDSEYSLKKFPQILELELSNRCNLECIMCNGDLSSGIRKNREMRPPLPQVFNSDFVDQLEPFLPHLREIRVNGGEPFLHSICFEIWERVAKVNPNIEITVATNGTVLNRRVKEILNKCRFRINVSIDSLDPENYEKIRVNGRLEKVLENTQYFGRYCKNRGSILSIMINPMRQNWWEMPHFLEYCRKNLYHLWFNTIIRPDHCSLKSWDENNLQHVYDGLSNYNFQSLLETIPEAFAHQQESNLAKFNNFVENQVGVWLKMAKVRSEGAYEQRERP